MLEGQSARLSAAALETLAIVAYKQPVSRAQVAAIRGVNVDGVMRTLQQRGYIEEVGQGPRPGPGRAVRHHRRCSSSASASTASTSLPPLSDFVPGADVVEHLEAGLRPPPGPSLGERLDEIEAANAAAARRAGRDPPRRHRPRSTRTEPVPGERQGDGVRLQKVLAQAGLGSRRVCEDLIEAGGCG